MVPHRALKILLRKPMFIQTDGLRLKRNDFIFPNTSNDLPKFKPISDEQIKKVNEILKEMPRRGRLLQDFSPEVESLDRREESPCSQGGTCEFFFYCWMVGGLLDGTCGGVLKGCCHRVAKAGLLGVQDSNSIDYESPSYGPVINDESKSVELCCVM